MKGMITWFARNPVAANLLMALILFIGGYSLSNRIPLEVFPEIDLDIVTVRVAYPGASPGEVEEGLAIRIEEELQSLEGIDRLFSRSSEGLALVNIEVAKGFDAREMLDDVKGRVDSINSFPVDAERPVVTLAQRQREVISAVVYGERSPQELRALAERYRDGILALPNITLAAIDAAPRYEIAIEVADSTLKEYGLTLAQVADAVGRHSLDLSAGNIRTQGADILVRTKGLAYGAAEFGRIPVLTRADGGSVTVADLARISDGFEEDAVKTRYDGRPAVAIEVYRTGDQNSITLAKQVRDYLIAQEQLLPEGVHLDYWRDRSMVVKARLNTLTNSAIQGGILVLLLLALFLRPKVAFWVCAGIPVAFMGGFFIMPFLGVTLNIISLFAFILVLGIVVDDAIVTGENIYAHFSRTGDSVRAAEEGTHEIAVPVTFGVLTTVVAFIPLLLVEGHRGAIFAQIPLVVIPVLLFSLVESKLVLPAHLRHMKPPRTDDALSRFQQRFSNGLEQFIRQRYAPVLSWVLGHRYLALAIAIGVSLVVFSTVTAGWTKFIFFPRVQSEIARASLTMPVGTPLAATDVQVEKITRAAQQLQKKYIDPVTNESVITHVIATSGAVGSSAGAHRGRVMFEIVAPEHRSLNVTSSELVREWRQQIGELPGVESVTYRAEIGRGGDPIDVQFNGQDLGQLKQLAKAVRQRLGTYPSLFDIADSLTDGKQELLIDLKPGAEVLGVSLADVARQVRQAFFGAEVQRVLRGRDEVKVMVRYAASERASLETLDRMLIRAANGSSVPLAEVARITPAQSPSAINRINRQRTVNVTADANKEVADVEAIKRDLEAFLVARMPEYPGVSYSFEGEAKEQRDSFSGLRWGTVFVLFAIFALLAIPFKSYVQPLIVMSVIPFGVVGAILGHWIMLMPLTIMSMMGMLALSGVVVNDSLVLVDYINRQRRAGVSLDEAVRSSGQARFRPVLLTSLTTFAGLMPLIFEKSTQAQFLIPMAVSLGFGILFATAVTLLIIPVNYLLLEDARRFSYRLFGRVPEDYPS